MLHLSLSYHVHLQKRFIFELTTIPSDFDKIHSFTTGAFTCLQVSFTLHREFGLYLWQTYIPSSLIVALSWVSFWLSSESVVARVIVGVTTILTNIMQLSASQQSLPSVAHTKAIDVWMASCKMNSTIFTEFCISDNKENLES